MGETKKPSLDEVQDLVKNAFGKRSRCDITGNSVNDTLFRIEEPFLVVRKGFLSYSILGAFDDSRTDGSKLKVFRGYSEGAEAYSREYEDRFGTSPEVELVDELRPYTTQFERFERI